MKVHSSLALPLAPGAGAQHGLWKDRDASSFEGGKIKPKKVFTSRPYQTAGPVVSLNAHGTQ